MNARSRKRRRDGPVDVSAAAPPQQSRRVKEPIVGVQGHRKIPSNPASIQIAVAEYGLPTLVEFADCAFQDRLEHMVRRRDPTQEDYAKRLPKRSSEQVRAARERHHDNLLARAMPEMPGVLPPKPMPQERSKMPRQKMGDERGTHLPQPATLTKVQAQLYR